MRRLPLAALAATLLCLPVLGHADEGMWTFHDFPSAKVKTRYGFSPDQAWLDKARMSSARTNNCSASFVSADGLVMTNHHCAHECLSGLSSADHDYVKNGFWAAKQGDEQKCPDLHVERLDAITDITERVGKATAGKSGAAFTAALRDVSGTIEKECQTAADLRCQVVELFHGGQYVLHKYKRFTDVRVVFAPEIASAFFGGDPDNFEFPRYDLDVSFLRVYENGKPAATPDHFTWSAGSPKVDELTFVSGNPGTTLRELTAAQLQFERDVRLPVRLSWRSEWRGLMTQFMRESDESHRSTEDWLFNIENSLKAYKGWATALADESQMKKKLDDETALRAKIKADPKVSKDVGDAYEAIAKALDGFKPYYHRYALFERGARSIEKGDLLAFAIQLVRGGDERAIASGKRLDEYRDTALPEVEEALASPAPVYAGREKLALAFWLGKLREDLGADDPTVKALLGKDTPETVAARWVDGTKLGDPAERLRLWKGGKAAIAAAKDPMIVAARTLDPAARKVRKMWDDQVDGVVKAATEKIAKARFAIEGRASYPDATFTLRLSYGAVKGYTTSAHGTKVPPLTYFAGAFERATGAFPFELPRSWLDARSKIDGKVTLDVATTNDIIGGNSGSPVFNKDLQIVGLIFDGNIESLAGDFWYDESDNRAVAVTSEGLVQALSKIYKADRLVDELKSKH